MASGAVRVSGLIMVGLAAVLLPGFVVTAFLCDSGCWDPEPLLLLMLGPFIPVAFATCPLCTPSSLPGGVANLATTLQGIGKQVDAAGRVAQQLQNVLG